ncbi:hypothetical protein M902_0249 [Bacteriovorax sp. BAL6_X]|uniref:hypothetical protein n=1 Tax=Bacteriovorax sp. BAL6_X TaxID=1201290 RepID=UPI00038650A1|nr:hypothetical protein [Bacteriovorax sp. BAL6_X]EPZ49294.1 hypothetical protein M902_0249 [Bacteriovorax sp. BAL6_X]
MKRLLITAMILTGATAQADLFDNLTANLNLSPSQSNNLRNGLASILSGSGSSSVREAEKLSFNKCFEMLKEAKQEQVKSDKDFIKSGYATGSFYSNVIEGDYQQFHDRNEEVSKFGRTLMRGITNLDSIRFNSTTSVKHAPHLDYYCSSYMDIENVSKVIVENKECRKVDLALNAIDANTKKKYKATASNFFCEGESIVKTDFTGKRFEVIYEMNEI